MVRRGDAQQKVKNLRKTHQNRARQNNIYNKSTHDNHFFNSTWSRGYDTERGCTKSTVNTNNQSYFEKEVQKVLDIEDYFEQYSSKRKNKVRHAVLSKECIQFYARFGLAFHIIEEECPICYETESKCSMIYTNCHHSFCQSCVFEMSKWYHTCFSCPLCRTNVTRLTDSKCKTTHTLTENRMPFTLSYLTPWFHHFLYSDSASLIERYLESLRVLERIFGPTRWGLMSDTLGSPRRR